VRERDARRGDGFVDGLRFFFGTQRFFMLERRFRGKGTVSLKLAFVVRVEFGGIADILVWGEVRGAP
jgi:hypothetical protein